MCGIVGIFDPSGRALAQPSILQRMADNVAHRGPNDYATYMSGNLALGFRRLAILDIEGGRQPMLSDDGAIITACNGEIYNFQLLRSNLEAHGHRFKTVCDVEVLPHLYQESGINLLHCLDGQFAIVIYDKVRDTLFLARDQFGINPLFYAVVNGVLVFSSEIKGILGYPGVDRTINLTALDQVLCFPGVVSPRTLFEGVSSVRPGHYLAVSEGGIVSRQYWDLSFPATSERLPDHSEKHYTESIRELLAQSVSRRLRADVPVGIYLSGGLDSSAIAGLVHTLTPSVRRHTFSISFNGQDMCERLHQSQIAQDIYSFHHDIAFDPEQVLARLAKMIFHSECPVKETYNTANLALSKTAKDAGVSVVLTGQGSDEIFAGYIGYQVDQMRRSRSIDSPDESRERIIRQQLWGDASVVYEGGYAGLERTKRKLYSSLLAEGIDQFDCFNASLINRDFLGHLHPLHQRSYLDFKLRLADHLLGDHGDRMAMANSVEGRHPFLDTELVKFVATIPPSLLLGGSQEKYLLKQAVRSVVPVSILNREKFGWFTPGMPELFRMNCEWVNDLLSYDQILRQGYFNPDTVEELKTAYASDGFWLALPFEKDLLLLVLTFNLFLQIFDVPSRV